MAQRSRRPTHLRSEDGCRLADVRALTAGKLSRPVAEADWRWDSPCDNLLRENGGAFPGVVCAPLRTAQ